MKKQEAKWWEKEAKLLWWDLKLFLFPLTFIVLYEFFHIKCYRITDTYSPIYFYILEGGTALSSCAAAFLSDKVSRKILLFSLIPIAILEFVFLEIGWYRTAILLSPLFVSTAVARVALIYNHEHRSIKNLICLSHIFVYIPWFYFRKIYYGNITFLIIALFVVLIFSSTLFKDVKSSKKNRKTKDVEGKKTLGYCLPISLLLAQFCFFMIVESSLNYGNKMFEFLGRGSLLAAILALFYKGNHKQSILITFMFLFILSFTALLSFRYWGDAQGLFSLGPLGVLGGFYLPIITEQFAEILGKHKRGRAIGVVELLIGLGNILALTGFLIINLYPFVLVYVIFFGSFGALVFFSVSMRLKKHTRLRSL